MTTIHRGILKQFIGQRDSGIAFLVIEDSTTHAIENVVCENVDTVEALEAAFGNVITEGFTANGDGFKNQEVYWWYDGLGLVLAGFMPVAELQEQNSADEPVEEQDDDHEPPTPTPFNIMF